MWAAVRCPEGAIVCIEPIPLIHAALEANLEWIQQHQTANGLQSARLKALNIGISDGTIREVRGPSNTLTSLVVTCRHLSLLIVYHPT